MLDERQIDRMLSKLKRFETTLEGLLFEKIDEVAVRKFRTMDQHHAIPEDTLFEPCTTGDVWGGESAYCWFKGHYTVPESVSGKTLYLYPRIEGYEALLWVNGKPFGTFCTKIVITGHGNHYCDMLVKDAEAGKTMDIALEYYAGHHVKGCMPFEDTGATKFDFTFRSLDICLKNETVSDFLFDLKTLNQLVEALDRNSFRRADVVNALAQVHTLLYYSYEDVSRETFMDALLQAHPILKSKLVQTNSSTAPYAGFIGHSHMDTAWLWPIKETIKKCARTYANQMSLMEQYPEYTFVQSSAYHGDMIRSYYPELFEAIRQKVVEGRYEPNGAVWVECDCNITSGEAMIRQFLWGQRFTREHFGYTSNAFWLPDTFGYSPSIPKIMKGCGVDYFLTTKMAWNDTTKFPYDTFYWEGLDGTRVLTHLNKTHIWPDPESMMEYVTTGRRTGDAVKEKTVSNRRLLSYGFGDGGGGPQFEMIEMARRVKDLEGLPRSEHTTVSRFMKELEETVVNPSIYSGELYLELHRGTLTNQHTIKRNNRKAEIHLRNLEFLTVREAVEGDKPSQDDAIRPLLGTLLVNQFHDILPGTCIPSAHDQSIQETSEVIEKAEGLINNIISVLPEGKTVSLINTLSFERKDVVYLDVEEGLAIDDPSKLLKQQHTRDSHNQLKLAVSGLSLPPLASVSLKLVEGMPNEKSAFILEGNRLETPHAWVTFDESGFMSSFIDKTNGRELKGEGYALNTFLLAEDLPSAWDNWDVDADIELKLKPCAQLLSRQIVSQGAVELRIRSTYRLSPKSTLTQDMVFYADSPEVRFETIMGWQDDHRFLKTAFDTTIHSDFSRQELQFGYIKRPTTRSTSEEKAKFEVCNHKYSDLSESRYGVAILNDCKYGISVRHAQMRLSLHKGGCRPDFRGDKGIHECTYSFYPHQGGYSAQNVIQPAYALNMPPLVVKGAYDRSSFINVADDNILIEAVKPCEDNEKAYILRLYDAEGTYTRTRLTLGHKAKKIALANMLEEEQTLLEGTAEIELVFKPFEIKTLKVSY